MELVKQKIELNFPGIGVELLPVTSRGDVLRDIPLQTMEGTDFFTGEIFARLARGDADIAVHSLKDMSGEHFFGPNHFAVIDRDDVRDLALFNEDVENKIKKGETLIVGTCSPRREEIVLGFLKKALPQWGAEIQMAVKPIRGNVETRLHKLSNGEYDATILATAGLNRLLQAESISGSANQPVHDLLKGKRKMLLPIFECVPAPCQGAIVAEAHFSNTTAIRILDAINDQSLHSDCIHEKRTAQQYGRGCLQKFGVTTIYYGDQKLTYAAGKDENEKEFIRWSELPELETAGKILFSSTDRMRDFFDYAYRDINTLIPEPVVYLANYKSIQGNTSAGLLAQLQEKRVWAAGTKTWFELAKKGVWVEGSADALGVETLPPIWEMPLLRIRKEEVLMITNENAAANWKKKGWNVLATHSLVNRQDEEIKQQVRNADILFWTSAAQYEQHKQFVKQGAVHACPFGETATLLKTAGIEPVVFPTIKSFLAWKRYSTP